MNNNLNHIANSSYLLPYQQVQGNYPNSFYSTHQAPGFNQNQIPTPWYHQAFNHNGAALGNEDLQQVRTDSNFRQALPAPPYHTMGMNTTSGYAYPYGYPQIQSHYNGIQQPNQKRRKRSFGNTKIHQVSTTGSSQTFFSQETQANNLRNTGTTPQITNSELTDSGHSYHRDKNNKRMKGKEQAISSGDSRKSKKRKAFDSDIPIAPRYLAAHKIDASPDEVAAWRAERRKKYPTAKNVERRRMGVQERETEPVGEDTASAEVKENRENSSFDRDARSSYDGNLNQPQQQKPCFKFFRNTCRRSAAQCRYSHDESHRVAHQIAERKKAERKQFMTNTARPKGLPSLRRKLLLADIKKERVVLLQCLHHLLLSKAKEQEST